MVNAQGWLDKNYPKEIRSEIKNLYLKEKGLEGNLDLRDFVNLERLDCSGNKLSGLDLSQGKNLIYLDCRSNELVELDLTFLNPKKITRICLNNNNLSLKNLTCFQNFVNLERLEIANYDEQKIQQGFYNRFYGSLRPMKNLTNLRWLNISNTDINSGVEYIPNNIERIYYSTKERSESKVKEISEQLNSLFKKETKKKDWTNIHQVFTKDDQMEWENLDFRYEEVKQWIEAGLKTNDYHFAAWLRWKGFDYQWQHDWEKLKKQDRSIQKWLSDEYSTERRKWVSWLYISKNGLGGELIIEDFPNLERIDCHDDEFVSLTLNNLPKLKFLDANNNRIKNFVIKNCSEIDHLSIRDNLISSLNFLDKINIEKLARLYISNNKFPRHDVKIFGKFVNLKSLWLSGNIFCGDLKTLRGLTKLEHLTIDETEINSDFEYLPNSLKEITSVASQTLKNDTDNFKLTRWIERKKLKGVNSEYYSVPFHDSQYWKEAQPYFKWLEKELKKINPKLNVYDVLGNIFFNVATGDFEGNLQSIVSLLQVNKVFFDEKEKELDLLKLRIQDLEQLIKNQKEKIVNAYLYFSAEKELVQELVKINLEFVKFKKKELNSSDYEEKCSEYERKCWETKEKLRRKLKKEDMNKTQRILTDCEELVIHELELEDKFNAKLLLLEEQNQAAKIVISSNMDSLKKRLQSHMEQHKLVDFMQEKIGQKIKEIERIDVFPTWFNDNCAIVINKEKNFNLWIVTYEPPFGEAGEKINCLKVAKLPVIKERWEEIIEHFKKALNSDYPAAEVHNNIYTFKLPSLVQDYGNIEKIKIKISPQTDLDDYINPLDIVKVNRKGGFYKHVGVYLGKNEKGIREVIHVRKNDGAGVRFGSLSKFLDGENQIKIYHPFIPFKKPELIQKHIDIAFKAGYGKGKYNLLKENCEHFANLCVYGLGISQQSKMTNKTTKGSDYLLQAIELSNKFFKKLEKEVQDRSDISSLIEIPSKDHQ